MPWSWSIAVYKINNPNPFNFVLNLIRIHFTFTGLQYVTEFRDEDPTKEVQYVCNLCELSCNSGNLVAHVMGIKHRYNYLVRQLGSVIILQSKSHNLKIVMLNIISSTTWGMAQLLHVHTLFRIIQKEHYMNYYTTIRQKQCKKSELTPIVDEYARSIEAEEGNAGQWLAKVASA